MHLVLCVLVTRIQFIAIEIARNRRGLNTCHSLNKATAETKGDKDETASADLKGITEDVEHVEIDKKVKDCVEGIAQSVGN